ncbi:MAG TPA: hypothetical protein VMV72_18895 [Verrucomicrobiae bacterium]|nr:hypothetical protein [Verrucomicrobiae bacterium]
MSEIPSITLWLWIVVILTYVPETFLNQADTSSIFSRSRFWDTHPRGFYLSLIVVRTLLGLAGLAWCIRKWRSVPAARTMALFFVGLWLVMLPFYTCYCWQEERFLLRLSGLFCVLNAIGPAVLLRSISEGKPTVPAWLSAFVLVLTSGLIVGLGAFARTDYGPPSGDNNQLYTLLQGVSHTIESNAVVVVAGWDPYRTDLYVIKGTQRILVPLTRDSAASFDAVDNPDKLLALMRTGRSGYLLTAGPLDSQEIQQAALALAGRMGAEPLLNVRSHAGQVLEPYLSRLHDPVSATSAAGRARQP